MGARLRRLLGAIVGGLGHATALLVVLALLLPTALLVYSTTDDFRRRLLARLEPELDRRMNGELAIGGLEGSPLRGLRLLETSLSWHGEPIARFDSATVALDWSALLFGRIRIESIAIESPRVVLREHPEHGWDWRQALAPLVPLAPRKNRPEPPPVVIERLALANGRLLIAADGRRPIELSGIGAVGRIDFPQERIEIREISLVTDRSSLAGAGEVDFQGGYRVDVTATALHPGDLARFSPSLAESLAFLPPAGGHALVSGRRKHVELKGRLEWPGTQLGFDLAGDPNPFDLRTAAIEARLESAALARFLPAQPFAGRLDATLELAQGSGSLRALVEPGGKGRLELAGPVSFVDVPEAKLELAAQRVDPALLLPARPEWKGALSGRGTLRLRGDDRASATASVDLALDRSRVGGLELRRARLVGGLEGERIELSTLELVSDVGIARVRGRLGTDPKAPVDLTAKLDVEELAPLLALAKRKGSGTLRGDVAVSGVAADARLRADLDLARIAFEGFGFERAGLALRARGRLTKGVDLRIETFRLATPVGDWRLDRPTRLVASSDAFELRDARLSSGQTLVALDGRLGRSGPQRFTLSARALPIADWAARVPDRIPPGWLTAGTLDLTLRVDGSAATPEIDLVLSPRDLALAERAIDRVEGRIRYDGRRAQATLRATTDPALSLEGEASLPFRLRWQRGLVAKATGDLDARARCDAADLRILKPLVEEQIVAFGGRGRCSIRLTGPLGALRPAGEVQLEALTGRPRRTGVTFIDGVLSVELAADRFHLRRATATAKGHEATARFQASGEGPLPAFLSGSRAEAPATNGDYTTRLELVRWPLVETGRDRLIASGAMTARGSLAAPIVEGHVEIIEGTLRPNLAFLSKGPPPRDPTIELERADETGTSDPAPRRSGAERAANLLGSLDDLTLTLAIDVGRDLWIKHEQAEVLLEGRIDATKQKGKPLSLEGRIDAQRGFADLQQRRFRLIEGGLELVGGARIDPVLDVLGRHKAREHTIDARLTGTASKPVLTLSSDPTLSQEDILAVLLFGRPATELSQNQQASLGQRAEELASSLGITAVGRSVAGVLGLDRLGLEIDELSSRRASVGAYVGRNIFVALAQEFSGERGQELSIEYEFWPGWSLVGSTTTQGTNSADLVWRIRY